MIFSSSFRWQFVAIVLATAFIAGGCKTESSGPGQTGSRLAPDDLMRHIRVLASDEFEGRAPGTRGEELTVDYLVNHFRRIGAKPGNPDSTFIQHVPLVGTTASDVQVAFETRGQRLQLAFPTETVVWTKRCVPDTKVENSEVVFVGYGVVAPEYGWDDFKDVDVRGKTIVMLINDPAVRDPREPDKLDEKTFKGRTMTYYGRWTYKFEIAAEKGAAAAIIVHETGPAGYPWAVVQGSNSRENFDLHAADKNMGRAPVEGWITSEIATRLFTAAGKDFQTLKRAAIARDFKPVPLGARATFKFKNAMRVVSSKNVIARIEGSDPALKNEHVIYSAHWDHLGRDATLRGDQIFNGARDNASGTASLLELAAAFARLPHPPKRSVLFLAVTAEEKGLLGAKYYARHPLHPVDQAVANINMDSMNPWGRTHDVTVIGLGQTTIEDVLRAAAAAQHRKLIPDAEPEKGRYFRSDHFEFAKVGVPGLYIHAGTNFVGRSSSFGPAKIDHYTAADYHKVSDEVQPDWDLSGAAEDTQLLFEVGLRIANDYGWPEWKPSSEFRKLREPRKLPGR